MRLPKRSRSDDVRSLSRRVFMLLGTLLLIVLAMVGLAERGLGDMRADLREQARGVAALRLVLNIDRDAYQAQLALERYARAVEEGESTTDALAFWSENSEQVLARWEQFTEIQQADPAEQRVSAEFERDRALWLADAQKVLSGARADVAALRSRSAKSFDLMRDHLDVLEEQFYEPAIATRARAAETRAEENERLLLSGLVLLLVLGLGLGVRTARQATRIGHAFVAREETVLEASEQQRFETSVHRALETAPDEPAVHAVMSRAVRLLGAGQHSSLLLADSSNAHMESTLIHGDPDLGCPVGVPGRCPAVTRATVQRFSDPEALDCCHHLTERTAGGVGAVCIPLSIRGRTTGVLHTVHGPREPVAEPIVNRLATLANHVGTRLGVLRAFATTSHQAERDPLTGLLNRRTLEAKVTQLAERGDAQMPVCVAMADLDLFKQLNDTHGHQTGDRALRLFSNVLREHVRSGDLVSRWGGEEFLFVLPATASDEAMNIIERLRSGLASTVRQAGVPRFSVSVGVAEGMLADDFYALIERADRALYEAKNAGRDRAHLSVVQA